MTMPSANGASAGGLAAEASQYLNPEMEEEWEMHETSHYSNPEESSSPESEWETHEAQSGDPYTSPEMEDEWDEEAARHAHRATPPDPTSQPVPARDPTRPFDRATPHPRVSTRPRDRGTMHPHASIRPRHRAVSRPPTASLPDPGTNRM